MPDKPMQDKTCLITGGTSGIGQDTALQLARLGARVIVVGRSQTRLENTVQMIRDQSGSDQVDFLLADLSSQREVRALVATFKKSHDRLDVLVNNAGAIFAKRELTEDGLERAWALNHMAYFILTLELLDLLKSSAPARIINVASGLHTKGEINFDDLNSETTYKAWDVYSNSKLANVLFTYALAKRLEGSGVTANCLHPGVVATGFGHNTSGPLKWLMTALSPFLISAKKGCVTSVYLASSAQVEGVTGKYFVKSRETASVAQSHDTDLQEKLWQVSLSQAEKSSRPG